MANDLLVPDQMSPEGMEIIEAYLECGNDVKTAAKYLGIPESDFRLALNKPEVKNYISTIFYETGYRNRDKLFGVLDEIISRKVQMLNDNPEYSTEMDIMDVLVKAHKMKMDEMKAEAALLEAKSKLKTTQNNTQNNIIVGDGSNWANLINKIAGGGNGGI